MTGEDEASPPGGAPAYPVAPAEPVTLRLGGGSERAGQELPLRLLCVGDFFGRADPRQLAARTTIDVTRLSIDGALSALEPSLSITVPHVIAADKAANTPLQVSLRMRRLSDFDPEAVAMQVPVLRELLDQRAALTALRGPLGGERDFRAAIVRIVSDQTKRARLRQELGLPPETTEEHDARRAMLAALSEARQTSSPARLDALSRHPAHQVRALVAENPATPVPALESLSLEHPYPVCRNPAMLAAVIAHGYELYARLPVSARLVGILARLSAEHHIRLIDSPDPVVRREIAGSDKAPRSVLERLGTDPDEEVRTAAGANRWASAKLRAEVLARRPPGSQLSYHFARPPDSSLDALPLDDLLALVRDPYMTTWSDILALERRALTPADVARLALDASPRVLRGLARNPACDDAILRRLAHHPDNYLGCDIASSTRSSAATLDVLTRHPDESVRKRAAERLAGR